MPKSITISEDYTVELPEELRGSSKWQPGQEIAFLPKDGHFIMVPVPKLEDLMGILPNADPSGYRDRSE